MKTRTRRTAIALALTSVLGVAGAGSAPSWASATNDRVDSQTIIEGTWRAVVTRQDCQTGAPGPTFAALLTFGRGGTLTETTAAFAPSQRTPGHGFWTSTGRRQFTAVSEAFLFSPTNVWSGVQRITQAITIGDDPRRPKEQRHLRDDERNRPSDRHRLRCCRPDANDVMAWIRLSVMSMVNTSPRWELPGLVAWLGAETFFRA